MSISKVVIDAGNTSHRVKKYDEVAIEYTGNTIMLCNNSKSDRRQDGSSTQINQTERVLCKTSTPFHP